MNGIYAIPTKYSGVQFRSRLEASWAAFFDLAGWEWEYEPCELPGWIPDFYLKFECGHSACNGYHDLLAEVKPFDSLEKFKGHIAASDEYFQSWGSKGVDGTALLGNNPTVSSWCISHGTGGGFESLTDGRIRGDLMLMWKEARNRTQWKK